MIMRRIVLAAVWLIVAPGGAWAIDYPCASDPGFCYRDFGNDGCFDGGTDDGPINSEIEDSEEFPVSPDPGSIVCPPSVGELTASDSSIRLETLPGSSILFYEARISVSASFDTISGADLLLGGSKIDGSASQSHSAEADVHLEGRVQLSTFGTPTFSLGASNGSIVLGEKARIKTRGDTVLSAPTGGITLSKGVVLQSEGVVQIDAGGIIEMTRPTVIAGILSLNASDVSIFEKGTLNTPFVVIDADPGDVEIERVTIKAGLQGFLAPLVISGTNVTIGIPQNGRTRTSKIKYNGDQEVFIEASDTIDIDELVFQSRTDVNIDTTGLTADLTNSKLVGIKNHPTFELTAPAGSTCDITGTFVKKADLVADCETVIVDP